MGLLPFGGDASLPSRLNEAEAASVVDDFIEWPYGRDPLDGHHITETIIPFASWRYDGDPLHWSPPRIAGFLTGWIPQKVIADDEWLDAVQAVFPRWLEFAAERRGLACEHLERNLSMAHDSWRFGNERALGPRSSHGTSGVGDVRRSKDSPSRIKRE